MSFSMPYLAIAASVSPPPAMLKARRLRRWRARCVSVPCANASNSNTPTGPFQTMVPAAFSCAASSARGLRADVEDQVVGRRRRPPP